MSSPTPATPPTKPVIIVGAGLAGLVAAYELTLQNIPVLLLDQENRANLGGQAFWSLGGLFCVNSAQQRRLGIKDSRELAMRDWLGSAQFTDGPNDFWPKQWAKAFVDFATDELEDYVKGLGLGFLYNVGWAERGDGRADGHGNSVPRFHLTWGTGPEVVRIFREPLERKEKEGLVEFKFRHCVDEIVVDDKTGRAIGVRGRVLQDEDAPRGVKSNRVEVDKFEIFGSAVLVSSGGIGGNLEKVKKYWPTEKLGAMPKHFVIGVPAHVDGRMLDISAATGANVVNRDRYWFYTEGLKNWNPIWPDHGIRVLPAPSSLWLDATGKRLPPFLFPGSDTLSTLKYISETGYAYSWFITTQAIVAREFALSGSEQNPDITGKSVWQVLMQRVFSKKGTVPVQNFIKHGEDFVISETSNLEELVKGMNELAAKTDGGGPALDYAAIKEVVETRDGQFDNTYSKDAQAMLIHNARTYGPDKMSRVAVPHKLLDPKHGPLIAVRMNLLTRKTLGGIETDLKSNALRPDGTPFPGLYAAGEVAGFGGGGVHGVASLEGTFLGGCIFSGRNAGRGIAEELKAAAETSS